MRSVVQRVARAAVRVDRQVVGEVGQGLCVLLGVATGDSAEECRWMADKLAQLRIFEDEAGKMNRSVLDVGGSVLLVSQFTLLGDARKGNRPSFVGAAPPEQASALYEEVAALLRARSVPVATGVFRAHMEVELVNDGPVTLILDSQR
jgi:D-tyrosyl-tRNA(Tyr) deacylase